MKKGDTITNSEVALDLGRNLALPNDADQLRAKIDHNLSYDALVKLVQISPLIFYLSNYVVYGLLCLSLVLF